MAASCFSPVNSAISFKNTFAGECKRRLTWFSWDSVAITGLFIPPKKDNKMLSLAAAEGKRLQQTRIDISAAAQFDPLFEQRTQTK